MTKQRRYCSDKEKNPGIQCSPFLYSVADIIRLAKTGANLTQDNPYARPHYPVLMVISGPSGVGKDTVARKLMERRPESFYFVVTATNREPREGEVHGVDYFFYSRDEFAQMIDDDELLEYAIVYNDFK